MSRIKKDPLAWIGEEDKEEDKADLVEPITRKRPGPKRILKREYEKSSEEGLQDNWTRSTWITRKDLLSKIKESLKENKIELMRGDLTGRSIRNPNEITLKLIMEEMMLDYIDKIERGED